MIDVCQWRASIGCWSCGHFHVGSFSSPFVQSSHNAARSRCFNGVVAGIICFSIALRFLLILSGDVELNPGPLGFLSVIGKLNAQDRKSLETAMQEGSIKIFITNAFMQGEARVGKSSIRCLLVSEKYPDKSSTQFIEPPKVIYHQNLSGSWKNVTEKEMCFLKTSMTKDMKECFDGTESSSDDYRSYHSSDSDSGPSYEFDEYNDVYNFENEEEDYSEPESPTSRKVREYEERGNSSECKQQLYFINFSGQLEFQKILPAFMPYASVLIVVVSLAKNLSDPSCTTMNINGKIIESKSEYSIPVEEVLKKVVSSVISSTCHFASYINKDADLKKYIEAPSSALLNIIPVATHRDKYEEIMKREESIIENSDKKVQKIREIFECHKKTCRAITKGNEIQLYEIDGSTAATTDFSTVNPEIEEISRALSDKAYEVVVPLRWHCLNILLQDKAKEGCGILTIYTCVELAQQLYKDMEKDEVVSALKFLHLLNKLLYYPDSEACSDLVFVQMDSLIDITKDLIEFIYEKRNCISDLVDPSDKRLVTRGQVSDQTLQMRSINYTRISEYFELKTSLLKLFQELLIAAPLPDKGQYFMPALLPVKNISEVKSLNTPPLLYYFKDAVPMGLFCAFIARLLSTKDSKLQWYIAEANRSHFSNYFTLKCRSLKNNFVLIEKLNSIEVHCDNTNPSMSLARDDIKKAIIEAIMIRSLGENVIPQEAFYCPCSNEQKHILLITKSITGERIFTCTKDPTKHIDDDRSWIVWLDISKNNDGQLTDSDTSNAAVDELSLADHNEIFGLLNNSITKWDVLGLKLGVRYTELDKIQTDCKDIDNCLMKMLAAWLKQSSGAGPPTYKQLVEALESIGETTLANEIKRGLSKRKGSKSDASASKRQCM